MRAAARREVELAGSRDHPDVENGGDLWIAAKLELRQLAGVETMRADPADRRRSRYRSRQVLGGREVGLGDPGRAGDIDRRRAVSPRRGRCGGGLRAIEQGPGAAGAGRCAAPCAGGGSSQSSSPVTRAPTAGGSPASSTCTIRPSSGLLGIGDLGVADGSTIAELAAGLGIERGAIEYHAGAAVVGDPRRRPRRRTGACTRRRDTWAAGRHPQLSITPPRRAAERRIATLSSRVRIQHLTRGSHNTSCASPERLSCSRMAMPIAGPSAGGVWLWHSHVDLACAIAAPQRPETEAARLATHIRDPARRAPPRRCRRHGHGRERRATGVVPRT